MDELANAVLKLLRDRFNVTDVAFDQPQGDKRTVWFWREGKRYRCLIGGPVVDFEAHVIERVESAEDVTPVQEEAA